MSREEQKTSDKKYYAVFSGAFRTKVPEGTPDALERVNKNGTKVSEREVSALFGKIEHVALEDSDFGKQIKITLDADEDSIHPILSFGVESKDGRDVLKKLPAVDFSKEVRVMPYRFVPEGESTERSGISITQQDADGKYTVKIQNFFFDPIAKKYLHGFPVIDWDKASEAEQKIYKIQRDAFLVQYLQEHILPKFSQEKVLSTTEEINPEDVPF